MESRKRKTEDDAPQLGHRVKNKATRLKLVQSQVTDDDIDMIAIKVGNQLKRP